MRGNLCRTPELYAETAMQVIIRHVRGQGRARFVVLELQKREHPESVASIRLTESETYSKWVEYTKCNSQKGVGITESGIRMEWSVTLQGLGHA